jgi:hypothetical protein
MAIRRAGKTGMARATDGPAVDKKRHDYSYVQDLPAGRRLDVMDKQIGDASAARNIWLRVRLSPAGVAPGGS